MRRAEDIELALKARPQGITLQRWLYESIHSAILTGMLAPGSRLPASRDLARQQMISRGTVLTVYDQLTAEGYLKGTVGRGTFVAGESPNQKQKREN